MSLVSDPERYFEALGGLHDARIEQLGLDIEAATFSLRLDDLQAAFSNPPANPPRPAMLVFGHVSRVRLAFDFREGVRIGSIEIRRLETDYELDLSLNLGGLPDEAATWRVMACFSTVSLVEIEQ